MDASSRNASTSPLARTVAVLVPFCSNAISPKLSPARSTLSEISCPFSPFLDHPCLSRHQDEECVGILPFADKRLPEAEGHGHTAIDDQLPRLWRKEAEHGQIREHRPGVIVHESASRANGVSEPSQLNPNPRPVRVGCGSSGLRRSSSGLLETSRLGRGINAVQKAQHPERRTPVTSRMLCHGRRDVARISTSGRKGGRGGPQASQAFWRRARHQCVPDSRRLRERCPDTYPLR